MEIVLSGLKGQLERPQTLKFAWPIVMLPEMFTRCGHLAVLIGYLASIGWEVYALDLNEPMHDADGGRSPRGFADIVRVVEGALAALPRDAIIMGHGLGGLMALKLAERQNVKAGVGIAPLVPGFATPLFVSLRNRLAMKFGRPLRPPTGKVLFDFVADADAFQRDTIIRALVPGNPAIAREIVRGEFEFSSDRFAPRLIVAGDADIFAPAELATSFAETIGARITMLQGRGHWLVGGRALERVIAETQRFLVRALGQDLLLLYPDELKDNGSENRGDG